MSGMRFTPKGYGGHRVRRAYAAALQPRSRLTPDEVKRDGWKVRRNRRASGAAKVRRTGLLAVAIDDDRLTWPERELVRQLGERLYGKRAREARHG